MDTVRIVLVRHGESEWNAAGLIQGHAGIGLTDRGQAQAEAVATFLAQEYPDCGLLVRSDLTRVAETAASTEQAFDLTARVDRRLREIDVGAWSGKTHEQVAVEDPDGLDAWQRGFDTPRGGGERLSELQARVLAAVHDVAEEAAAGGDDTAILFTHGGPVRAVVEAVVGLPVDRTRVLGPVGNGSMTLVEWDTRGEGSRLLSYNGCGHLPVFPAGTSVSSLDVAR